MPINRKSIKRDAKVADILDAAEQRLLAGGYEKMSVVAIARDLHLAQNSIHWYFPSKDELFVAVLRRMLTRLTTKKPPHDHGLTEQVLWVTDQMAHLGPLHATLRARAEHSTVAASFQVELDRLIRGLLLHAIEPYVEASQLDTAADAFLATVEGTMAQHLPTTRRHQIIAFSFERLIGPQEGRRSERDNGQRDAGTA